ncbi:MAG: SDR family oxidoreductase [Saprospiraceae bacterium]|nr:SDR family oxidoreductase [Saprospiraceae bacterium]
MEIRIDNQTAIITGGGSGIGEALSITFAQAGARVHIVDRDVEATSRVAKRIRAQGGTVTVHMADVSIQQEMLDMASCVLEQDGRIDILINNAGIAQIGTLDATTEEALDRIYAVNVKGVYNGMYAVISAMKNQKRGVILNMASIAAMIGLPDRFGYSMSKGAVLSMTLTAARDYLDYNIRCNCISPARIHTPFVDGFIAANYPGREDEMFATLSQTQPIGRMGTPQEVAQLALYLCSDAATFITGTNVPIDGGFINLNT